MKRSKINKLQRETLSFFESHNFHLPKWATWRREDWLNAGNAAMEVRRRCLGWDVTDFGLDDFENKGLILFTIRNGPKEGGEPYCEKVMVLRDGQVCLTHFHWEKTEDIINRAGARLVLRFWGSDNNEQPTETPVTVRVDGVERTLGAGEGLVLEPGESVTITPGLYHEFFAGGGDVLVGEVSSVNDDEKDNRFLENVGRFPPIEEDEDILYFLCNEYP